VNWQPDEPLLPLKELDEKAHLAEELYVMLDLGWNRLRGLPVDDEVDGRLSLGAETEPASLDLQPAPHAPRHAMSAAQCFRQRVLVPELGAPDNPQTVRQLGSVARRAAQR